MNLVLDDVKETMRGEWLQYSHISSSFNSPTDDEGNKTTRSMGLIVARGTLIVLISPADGSEEIPNPFLSTEE